MYVSMALAARWPVIHIIHTNHGHVSLLNAPVNESGTSSFGRPERTQASIKSAHERNTNLSICLSISIYLSIYLSTCLSIYLSRSTSICICTYIYIHVYIYIHIYIYICIYIYKYMCVYIHIYITHNTYQSWSLLNAPVSESGTASFKASNKSCKDVTVL